MATNRIKADASRPKVPSGRKMGNVKKEQEIERLRLTMEAERNKRGPLYTSCLTVSNQTVMQAGCTLGQRVHQPRRPSLIGRKGEKCKPGSAKTAQTSSSSLSNRERHRTAGETAAQNRESRKGKEKNTTSQESAQEQKSSTTRKKEVHRPDSFCARMCWVERNERGSGTWGGERWKNTQTKILHRKNAEKRGGGVLWEHCSSTSPFKKKDMRSTEKRGEAQLAKPLGVKTGG